MAHILKSSLTDTVFSARSCLTNTLSWFSVDTLLLISCYFLIFIEFHFEFSELENRKIVTFIFHDLLSNLRTADVSSRKFYDSYDSFPSSSQLRSSIFFRNKIKCCFTSNSSCQCNCMLSNEVSR